MKTPVVFLYSTTLHAWEVWQSSRPLAHGTLAACRAAYPDAPPVADRQLRLAAADVLTEPLTMLVRPVGASFPEAVVSFRVGDGEPFVADLTTPVHDALSRGTLNLRLGSTDPENGDPDA